MEASLKLKLRRLDVPAGYAEMNLNKRGRCS